VIAGGAQARSAVLTRGIGDRAWHTTVGTQTRRIVDRSPSDRLPCHHRDRGRIAARSCERRSYDPIGDRGAIARPAVLGAGGGDGRGGRAERGRDDRSLTGWRSRGVARSQSPPTSGVGKPPVALRPRTASGGRFWARRTRSRDAGPIPTRCPEIPPVRDPTPPSVAQPLTRSIPGTCKGGTQKELSIDVVVACALVVSLSAFSLSFSPGFFIALPCCTGPYSPRAPAGLVDLREMDSAPRLKKERRNKQAGKRKRL
jgi:hypothetical protein